MQNADHKDPDLKNLAGVYNREYVDTLTLEGGTAKCEKCGKQATTKMFPLSVRIVLFKEMSSCCLERAQISLWYSCEGK